MAIKPLRERVELWKDLGIEGDIPEGVTLTNEEASIYLGIGEKTLARMRADKTGPTYIQPQTKTGSKARNQKVFYKVKALKAWQKQHEHDSTIDVLIDRGILVFDSLADLMKPQPFFVRTVQTKTKSGLDKRTTTKVSQIIVGHLLCVSKKVLRECLTDRENVRLVEVSLDEAMAERWANAKARKPFHNEYCKLLTKRLDQSNAQQERAELTE